MDWDNLSNAVKPLVDGLADAEVMGNDWRVKDARVRLHRAKRTEDVQLTIILEALA